MVRPLVITLAALVSAPAVAQDPPLEAVEQGVGDVGILSTSLRQVDAGLQQPSGFEHVYRVPGFANMYMRVDGGLFAVFPTSTYERGQATIPSNTVFFIGRPSDAMLRHYAGQPLPMSVSGEGRLDPRVTGVDDGGPRDLSVHGRELSAPRGGARGPAIVSDAAYRRQRLRALLGAAARAGR